MFVVSLLVTLAAAPVASAPQAVMRLRAAKGGPAMVAAVKDVSEACRGKLRHTLRDDAALFQEAKRIATTKTNAERRAALDLFRCFSEAKNIELIRPNLEGGDLEMIAYAAEVGARLESAAMIAPLLGVLKSRQAGCLAEGRSAAEIEVCVWLTYGMGPGLSGADKATRAQAGEAAAVMTTSPYKKVREVSVETLAATRLAKFAKPVAELIQKEKKGAFADANDAALLGRFADREKKLRRAK